MSYFDDPQNVEAYVKMAEGYDGRELIEILKTHLAPGAGVLELGMGPGVDFELLAQTYQVTGSDASQAFLDRYRKKNPQADLLLLDAVTLETDRRFEAIYSNKVLHHLSQTALAESFQRQAECLADGGLLMHSFWYGDREEEMHGLHFSYYTEDTLRQTIPQNLAVIDLQTYAEMEADDSLYIILQKK